LKNVAISDKYAISEIPPEGYAIGVSGAKLPEAMKNVAISDIYAISVISPGDYAISAIWANS
jgi:hypothetical protein